MTKAAMERLLKSKFFHEVEEIVKAWDYYTNAGDKKSANEMAGKWSVAKLALEHITGNAYWFSHKGAVYSIVNENDQHDVLLTGRSAKKEEAVA